MRDLDHEQRRRTFALLVSIAAGAGCAAPIDPASVTVTPAARGYAIGDEWFGPYHGLPVPTSGARSGGPLEQALGTAHTLYLDFDGVTLQASDYDDDTHNASSIAGGVGHSITVPAFDSSSYDPSRTRAQVMADVVAAVSRLYGDFDVQVVTTRPASGAYVLVAIGGLPDLINQPCQQFQGGCACVAGFAPLDCQRGGNGQIAYNVQGDVEVVYAFSDVQGCLGDTYSGALNSLAVTIAQETAHSYGLGHANDTNDVMYPQTASPTASFLDQDIPYADSNNCAQGQGTQNSHRLLLQILGASTGPTQTNPPTVAISAPSGNAVVGRSFTAQATASAAAGLAQIALSLTGPEQQSMTFSSSPVSWSVTVGTDGSYTLTATATDANGATATDMVSFTVKASAPPPQPGAFGARCTANTDCASQLCVQGRCNQTCGTCPSGWHCGLQNVCLLGNPSGNPMPMQGGNVGDACQSAAECRSGRCAASGGLQFCTDKCSLTDAASCPSGLTCASLGSDGDFCIPSSLTGGTGGGCSLGPRSPAGARAFALLALLVLPLLRRRSRR